MNPQDELEQQITERIAELPQAVRDAIISADVPTRLRTLSDAHKLHLDQWQMFENEVMLALLGFQRVEDLEQNIATHVKVAPEMARQLATDVNVIIFEPIRQELERGLEHPGAQAAEASSTEALREQVLGEEKVANSSVPQPQSAPAVRPATPPSSAPDVKVTRPTDASEYKPGQVSHERKNVVDDPYRESVA